MWFTELQYRLGNPRFFLSYSYVFDFIVSTVKARTGKFSQPLLSCFSQ